MPLLAPSMNSSTLSLCVLRLLVRRRTGDVVEWIVECRRGVSAWRVATPCGMVRLWDLLSWEAFLFGAQGEPVVTGGHCGSVAIAHAGELNNLGMCRHRMPGRIRAEALVLAAPENWHGLVQN